MYKSLNAWRTIYEPPEREDYLDDEEEYSD